MRLRSRRLTSLALAGSMIAGGGLALGAADAMAYERNGTTPTVETQRAAKAGNGPVATAVRNTLDVTKAELRTAKRAGTSLAALAKEKGVERDTLVNAIATAIGKTTKGASLTAAQRTTIAERMVDRPCRALDEIVDGFACRLDFRTAEAVQRLLAGGDDAEARRHHHAFLRGADGNVDTPVVHSVLAGAERGNGVDQQQRRMSGGVDRRADLIRRAIGVHGDFQIGQSARDAGLGDGRNLFQPESAQDADQGEVVEAVV